MKLLENPVFEQLNSYLNVDTVDCRLSGRLESYSCKMVGCDKKLFKAMNSVNEDNLQILSPSQSSLSPSKYSSSYNGEDTSPIYGTCGRRTFFYLISTLNAAFNDYRFSEASTSEFSRENSLRYVQDAIDKVFLRGELNLGLKHFFWQTIDKEISLEDCEVYSYNPDMDANPFADEPGFLWSFTYFLFNARIKRVVLLHCVASHNQISDSGVEHFSMEMEF